jgi:Carbohydrate binding module (family 6)
MRRMGLVSACVCVGALMTGSRGGVLAASATPYSGTPVSVPGRIAAQNFDDGGEGVAYHDSTSGNSGGAYRATDVDLEPSSEGGYDVGWTAAGEWLNYTASVTASGSYTAQLRVASIGGGSLHIGFNGPSTGTWKSVSVPSTGDWQSWTTVNVPLTLAAGVQQMTLMFDTPNINILYVDVTSASGSISGSGSGSSATGAFSGTPVSLPGRIEAENFDSGNDGVSYHDTTPGNSGGSYRNTNVDIEPSSEGGYDVGWIAGGEWMNYAVAVSSAGAYTANLRVASPNGGGSLHIGFNAPSNVWTTVSIPATGGWQNWTTVSVPVTLGAGAQLMTLGFDTGGFNVDYVDVSSGGSSSGSSVGSSALPPSPSGGGGGTVTVPQGANLQAYLDAAQPGDTLLLLPGVTYSGNFVLPAKSGSSYITVKSAADPSSLPGDGVRVGPQYASQLPKIQGGFAGGPAFVTASGAHHWRLQWLEIMSTYVENQLIELGDSSSAQSSLSVVPHDIVIDRCYIHGDPNNGQKRGIALNSASTWIVNSYISDIKSSQEDTQAIAGWNGPGPYTIENNYLQAAGEVILFGGGDPYIQNLVPSDISIRYNRVTKSTSWRGQSWVVKNLIELKNAQRVVIDSNVIENNWAAAQDGYGIVLTPRNQDGRAPWSVVQHVQVTNNVVQHIAAGFNVLALDATTYQVTNDIAIKNNLFLDVSKANWGGSGWLMVTQGGDNIVVDHNTVFTDGTSVVWADVAPVTGFVFTNNIIPDNAWAIMGTGSTEGNSTLNAYYPGATFQKNVIIGGNSGLYPPNNYFPGLLSAIMFLDPGSNNFALSPQSPFKNLATDGTDIGCLVSALSFNR